MRPTENPAETGGALGDARWNQFWIGLALMLPWPVLAFLVQPLPESGDFVIYLIGLLWNVLWDPIAAAQGTLTGVWSSVFTVGIVALFTSMWLAIAALPLLGHWPGRQVIGLWSLQFAYAGAQAVAGFVYAKSLLGP